MNAQARGSAWIDDRPAEGIFRVRRSVFTDPALFEAEMAQVFERSWNYLCHESQLRGHGDYVATTIGRRPVFAIRRRDGAIAAYHDACSHRGSRLTTRRAGTARTLTCRYHGWCFNTEGDCTLVRGGGESYQPAALERMGTSLRPIAGLGIYKGFVFGCLDPAAANFDNFIAPAAPFIDLMADQSPGGMEVLAGDSRYVMKANWKLQTENSTDGYHVATVHRNYASTMSFRDSLLPADSDATRRTEASRILSLEAIGSGGYDTGNGHMINWSDRASPESGPLYESRAELLKRFPEGKVRWMVDRGRTVTIFPNLLLNDVASTCIRLWRPVAVDRTEIDTWCLAPVGESAEARRARIRKYEDFFFPASLAVPDDVRAMEGAHAGSASDDDSWNDLSLGYATMVAGADDAAKELGVTPLTSNPGREVETGFYGFYREWARLLDGAP